ncbi:MAG: FlgD immunoglobulin-like domain containing protein [Bacteroidota bacterium]
MNVETVVQQLRSIAVPPRAGQKVSSVSPSLKNNGNQNWTSEQAISTLESPTIASGIDIAIIHAEDIDWVQDVGTKLLSTGKFNSITLINGRSVVPTLSQLQAFKAVLVFSDYLWPDKVALGNVVAEYIESGGGVVCAIFETSGVPNSELGGNFSTYKLIDFGSAEYTSGSLGTIYEPTHPIMQGVTSFTTGSYGFRPSNTTVSTGAVKVADWDNGKPLIVYKDNVGPSKVRRVDLGFFPVSDAVISGLWNSNTDGAKILANAIFYVSESMDWLNVSPVSGTVPPGETQNVEVAFNATGLLGGDYRTEILIASNDPGMSSKKVPASLHVTGHPIIEVTPNSINAGTIFVGLTKTDTINVHNAGSDQLIVSNIVSTVAEFVPNITNFTLSPGATQPIIVTFIPSDSLEYNGMLTISNNDTVQGDVTVTLQGRGVFPPVLTVTPDSVMVTLEEGDSTIQILTIGNTGQGTLTWNLGQPQNIAASQVLREKLAINKSKKIDGNSAEYREGNKSVQLTKPHLSPTSTVLLIQDVNPWGFNANQVILNSLAVPYDILNSSQLSATSLSQYKLVIVASDQSSSFYTQLQLNSAKINDFVIAGGVLEYHAADNSTGSVSTYTLPGGIPYHRLLSNVNHIIDVTHPIVAGIPNPFNGTYASHVFFSNVGANVHVITTDDQNNITLIEYNWGNGKVIASGQTLEFGFGVGQSAGNILVNMIPYSLQSQSQWLTVNPTSGTVLSNTSQDVELGLNASNLFVGQYTSTLLFTSNDPVNSSKTVPVHLTVTPGNRPAIVVTKDSLHTFVTGDASTTMSFFIKNVGTQPLDFTISDTMMAMVMKQFANNDGVRRANGVIGTKNVRIKNIAIKNSAMNDGKPSAKLNSPVSLRSAMSNPKAVPQSANRKSPQSIASISWLTESPLSGSVAANDSIEIVVTFDGTGLASGEYHGTINIASNDPFKSNVQVQASMVKLLPNFTTDDNENNVLAGIPDFDMDNYLFNDDVRAPIEFNVFVDADAINSAQLNMMVWDVDWDSGERDSVVFNGHFIGYLTGANGEWSTSIFFIDPAWIVPGPNGKNLVQVFIDVLNISYWAVTVDWGQLVINGATGLAHFRFVNTNKSTYSPGDSLWTYEEVDTDSLPMSVRVETDIVDPSNNIILGTNRTLTVSPGDEPFSEFFMLPTTLTPGTYTVMTILYDALTNLQQDIRYTEFNVQLPAPVNVFAGNGFDAIVPLTWDLESDPNISPVLISTDKTLLSIPMLGNTMPKQTVVNSLGKEKRGQELLNDQLSRTNRTNDKHSTASLSVDHFNVYRSATSGGPYDFVASVFTAGRTYGDHGDYVDYDVVNGQTYYYVVTTMYSNGESGYSMEMNATPQMGGQTYQSLYASVEPSLDGIIAAGEWNDATTVDIHLDGNPQPIKAKIKNTSTMLYLAIDDMSNTSGTDFNEIGIYFDADNNHTWDADNTTREGNFWVNYQNDSTWTMFRGMYGDYPSVSFTSPIAHPAGVTAKAAMTSGHLQYEIAIELGSEYFAVDGDSVNLWIFNYDSDVPGSYYYRFNGSLPIGSIWAAPQTFGTFILSKEQHMTLPLNTGWNLISWNVDTQIDSTTVLLSPILSQLKVALGFEQGGLTFDPAIPSEFNTLKSMDHFHGFWLKMTSATALDVIGTPVDMQSPIFLESGFNLVSYLPQQSDSTAHALASVMNHTSVVLGFDGGGLTYDPSIPSEFNTLHVLNPGFGYWIKTTSPETLTYQNPLELHSRTATIVRRDDSRNSHTNVVPTNEWISTWGDNIRMDGELLSVGTKITAVDKNGVVCGEYVVTQPGKFGLLPIYRDDPNTETDEGAVPNEGVSLFIGTVKVPTEIRWTQFGDVFNFGTIVTALGGDLRSLPKTFSISQNYPNPFNPSTTIRYELPKDASVSLKIYNMLGEEIATVVNNHQSAGFYSIEWDGKTQDGVSAASGVYFYHITAGDFKKTMKMVLIK